MRRIEELFFDMGESVSVDYACNRVEGFRYTGDWTNMSFKFISNPVSEVPEDIVKVKKSSRRSRCLVLSIDTMAIRARRSRRQEIFTNDFSPLITNIPFFETVNTRIQRKPPPTSLIQKKVRFSRNAIWKQCAFQLKESFACLPLTQIR